MRQSFFASLSNGRFAAALLLLLAGPLPALAAPKPAPSRLHLDVLSARVSAHEVQNRIGNAFGLQGGWSPRLRYDGFAFGLRLLGEYGGLRTTVPRYFSVVTTQALIDWQVAPRLELGVGGGTQFWLSPAAKPVTRPIVTLEAHYVPPRKLWRVIRSGYVAASAGASSGVGLQVRAGLELDFGSARQASPSFGHEQACQKALRPHFCPKPHRCPACQPAAVIAPVPAAEPIRRLSRSLIFDFNSAVLHADVQAYLKQLADALSADSEAWTQLSIVGHGNSIGTAAHNMTVSIHRAHAVEEFLVAAQVPRAKIHLQAVGKTQPLAHIAPDADEQRRVTLTIEDVHSNGALRSFLAAGPEGHQEPQP